MTRHSLILVLAATAAFPAAPAVADPGHLADAGGHDHWVAGIAIGLAILAGLWGAWKGARRDTPDAADAAAEDADSAPDQEQAA